MRTQYDDVIRAWIDGAEVEQRHPHVKKGKWHPFDGVWAASSDTILWHYRLAATAKKPKYLYVYRCSDTDDIEFLPRNMNVLSESYKYFGKIRLEE